MKEISQIENEIKIIEKKFSDYDSARRIFPEKDKILSLYQEKNSVENAICVNEEKNKYYFNNTKKAQFITYAVSYINWYINRCVNGNSSKEIENNKVGILRGAQAQFEQGVITKEQHKEIKDIVGFFPTIMLFW